MLKNIAISSMLIALMSSPLQAAENYVGQFVYRYAGGVAYRVVVKDSDQMTWECIEGEEKGAKGVERPERFKINSQTYFVTWTEKSGVQVSQAIDLKGMKVYSTIIAGKERYVLEGSISREK